MTTLPTTAWDQMNLSQLKEELKSRHLSILGLKSELINRLKRAEKQELLPEDREVKEEDEEEKKKPFICLNLIVRDEAHVLEETLTAIIPFIDMYIILDTGSKDNTIELIKQVMNKHGITNGEIHSIPPVPRYMFDFGEARTKALELCKGKSKWIWINDADNLIVPNGLTKKELHKQLNQDFQVATYRLLLKENANNPGGIWREQLIRNDFETYPWQYCCVRHECVGFSPEQEKKFEAEKKVVIRRNYTFHPGFFVLDRRLGSRNKDPLKEITDVLAMEMQLAQKKYMSRLTFYAARSWKSTGNIKFALTRYEERVKMGDSWEEIYESLFQIAECKKELNYPDQEVVDAYLAAIHYLKNDCSWKPQLRAEPYYEIASLYARKENWPEVYFWARKASVIPYPSTWLLWKNENVYAFYAKDLLARAAYFQGNYVESATLYYGLLNNFKELGINEYQYKRILEDAQYPYTEIKKSEESLAALKTMISATTTTPTTPLS